MPIRTSQPFARKKLRLPERAPRVGRPSPHAQDTQGETTTPASGPRLFLQIYRAPRVRSASAAVFPRAGSTLTLLGGGARLREIRPAQ
eukprot:gene20097-biopygen23536